MTRFFCCPLPRAAGDDGGGSLPFAEELPEPIAAEPGRPERALPRQRAAPGHRIAPRRVPSGARRVRSSGWTRSPTTTIPPESARTRTAARWSCPIRTVPGSRKLAVATASRRPRPRRLYAGCHRIPCGHRSTRSWIVNGGSRIRELRADHPRRHCQILQVRGRTAASSAISARWRALSARFRAETAIHVTVAKNFRMSSTSSCGVSITAKCVESLQ